MCSQQEWHDFNHAWGLVKAAPWNNINFRFQYCNEVVYPPDHDFMFFRVFRFKKIYFSNISMNPIKTQTNFLYTQTLAKGRLNVPTALGHMLMSSAQRWADNQCCRCIPYVLTIRHQLGAIALILPSKTWEYVV